MVNEEENIKEIDCMKKIVMYKEVIQKMQRQNIKELKNIYDFSFYKSPTLKA
jgi:hypothetical protein